MGMASEGIPGMGLAIPETGIAAIPGDGGWTYPYNHQI